MREGHDWIVAFFARRSSSARGGSVRPTGKMHEIIRTNYPEDGSDGERESPACGIVDDRRRGKFILHTASLQLRVAGGQNILDPLTVSAIGEGDQKSARLRKNIYRRAVESARLSTHMGEDAEAGHSAGEKTGDAVQEEPVERSYPSLTETDQENWSQQDCERDQYGNGRHGCPFLASFLSPALIAFLAYRFLFLALASS